MLSTQSPDSSLPVTEGERARLEDLLEKTSRTFAITIPLLRGDRVSFHGVYHHTEDAVLIPPPPRSARIPGAMRVLIAAKGEPVALPDYAGVAPEPLTDAQGTAGEIKAQRIELGEAQRRGAFLLLMELEL